MVNKKVKKLPHMKSLQDRRDEITNLGRELEMKSHLLTELRAKLASCACPFNIGDTVEASGGDKSRWTIVEVKYCPVNDWRLIAHGHINMGPLNPEVKTNNYAIGSMNFTLLRAVGEEEDVY